MMLLSHQFSEFSMLTKSGQEGGITSSYDETADISQVQTFQPSSCGHIGSHLHGVYIESFEAHLPSYCLQSSIPQRNIESSWFLPSSPASTYSQPPWASLSGEKSSCSIYSMNKTENSQVTFPSKSGCIQLSPSPSVSVTNVAKTISFRDKRTVAKSLPAAKDALLLDDVAVKNPNLRPSLAAMLEGIRQLSYACFDEDVTQIINKKTGWKINLLVTPDESGFLGFLSYRIRRQHGSPSNLLEIAKLAICNNCRHLGYGRRLIKGILTFAKKMGNIEFVGLSSLAEAVNFYQRLGFKRHDDVKFTGTATEKGEQIISGQVYMEMRIRCTRNKDSNSRRKKK